MKVKINYLFVYCKMLIFTTILLHLYDSRIITYFINIIALC